MVLAEAEVPQAIAEAFRNGRLGVMDYYNLRNLQSDTQMRNAIAGVGGGERPIDELSRRFLASRAAGGAGMIAWRRRGRVSARREKPMEDYIWIIFVIIGFGVWLVVTVFRKAEEERQRTQQQQRPRPDRGGRPTTDLERFLEEARRRGERGAAPPPARSPRFAVGTAVAPPPRRPPARRSRRTPAERPRDFPPVGRRPATEPRPSVPSAARNPPPKPASPR